VVAVVVEDITEVVEGWGEEVQRGRGWWWGTTLRWL
jgi:hypothetical protein